VRQTPVHDEFGLNVDEWELSSQFNTSGDDKINREKLEKLRVAQMRENLKNSLSTIPKPKHEYEIEIPTLGDEDLDETNIGKVMDAEDEQRLMRRNRLKALEKERKRRSLAVQKNLPRPFTVKSDIYGHLIANKSLSELRKEAELMLNNEIIKILAYDSQRHPFPGCKVKNIFSFL
jgi:pre-mRNA-splicing factor CDC5/CEF1